MVGKSGCLLKKGKGRVPMSLLDQAIQKEDFVLILERLKQGEKTRTPGKLAFLLMNTSSSLTYESINLLCEQQQTLPKNSPFRMTDTTFAIVTHYFYKLPFPNTLEASQKQNEVLVEVDAALMQMPVDLNKMIVSYDTPYTHPGKQSFFYSERKEEKPVNNRKCIIF